MSEPRLHLRSVEEAEGVRYALWDMDGRDRYYDPCVWRSRAGEQQKRAGWEM